jgi:hypothetical protein
MLVLAVFIGALVVLAVHYWPDPSYDYGYDQAFVDGQDHGMVGMPNSAVCIKMAERGIHDDSTLNYATILSGCQHGYFDAANGYRARLGWTLIPWPQ